MKQLEDKKISCHAKNRVNEQIKVKKLRVNE
jgi:hypothetical protein